MLENLKNPEFLIKWISTILVVIGAYLTAYDYTPINKYIMFVSSVGWTWIGWSWRQPALWLLNGYLALVYLAGILGL